MTRAVDRTGQADAVAAGPFNADGLDATIRLGPGEPRSIPLRIGTERVGAQADARLSIATATCMCVWVSTPTITVCASCRLDTLCVTVASSGGGAGWSGRADRTVMGRSCGRPLSGHGPSGQRATE